MGSLCKNFLLNIKMKIMMVENTCLTFSPSFPLHDMFFSRYFRAKWRPLFIYFSLLTGPSRIIVTCTGQINLASTFAHIGDEVTVVSTETEKCCQPL